YVVFELLEGKTLRQRMGTAPLPARKAAEYGVQIARGLAAAHEKGIVHRDIKPENLFVTDDGRLKILDFGLAKLNPVLARRHEGDEPITGPTVTGPQAVIGTAAYMSPEQVRGLAVDGRSDIFALGAVLYEMLSGQRAFHKQTAVETQSAVLNE